MGILQISTLRHGTTTYNKLQKIAGTIDCSLDTNGINQAIQAKKIIERENFDIIISSPLVRCLETAYICTGLTKQEIIINKDCIERNYGKMQGLTRKEIKKIKPKILYLKVGKYYHSLNPPNGESFEQLRIRALHFYTYLINNFTKGKILVISHQTFLQQLHGIFLGLETYHSLNLDIHTLEINHFYFNIRKKMLRHDKRRLSKENYGSW